MPTHEHLSYQQHVHTSIQGHAADPGLKDLLRLHAEAIDVLWGLDLEPAREILERCYAESPRGTQRKDPVIMLRSHLLAILLMVGINKWVPTMRASWLLRVLVGLPEDGSVPGVGTHYDFQHRLHDGPLRRRGDVILPSEHERERAKTPKNLRKQREEAKERMPKGEPKSTRATTLLVKELEKARDAASPADLLHRLAAILLEVGVKPSFAMGLLGKPGEILVGGDGSPLRTGGNRHGRKPEGDVEGELRIHSDPDAQWGWDSHREVWYYGHHFYEFCALGAGHDLPLFLRLDPANRSEKLASLEAFDQMRKVFRERMPEFPFDFHLLQDAGHDSEWHWRYPMRFGVTPIIPLAKKAPAEHPDRPETMLSPKGLPLCPGMAEMKPWGSFDGRRVFVCPKKGGALDICPLAPQEDPDWCCRPGTKLAPSMSLSIDGNPRLTPPVPRGSKRWKTLYAHRSGSERSNSVKKETFRLEQACHRRHSFWLIRLHLMAILQHAKAWARQRGDRSIVDEMLAVVAQAA